MYAGPAHTCWYQRDEYADGVGTNYLEAVNEMNEKIRPTFVIKSFDAQGAFMAGVSGHNGVMQLGVVPISTPW